jgi:hypothetical protein
LNARASESVRANIYAAAAQRSANRPEKLPEKANRADARSIKFDPFGQRANHWGVLALAFQAPGRMAPVDKGRGSALSCRFVAASPPRIQMNAD